MKRIIGFLLIDDQKSRSCYSQDFDAADHYFVGTLGATAADCAHTLDKATSRTAPPHHEKME